MMGRDVFLRPLNFFAQIAEVIEAVVTSPKPGRLARRQSFQNPAGATSVGVNLLAGLFLRALVAKAQARRRVVGHFG
jgi:hypothetical protein